jgi:hypothetical protein
LLVVVDEPKVSKEHDQTIKRLITGKTIEIHQKNKDLRVCPNYTNYILLTDQSKPFQELNEKQRRYCIMDVSNKYAGTAHEEYWKRLRENIMNQGIANKFAKYLFDRPPKDDLRKWPVTEAFQEMVDERNSHESLEYLMGEPFLKDFPTKKAPALDLWNKCNQWISQKYFGQKGSPFKE